MPSVIGAPMPLFLTFLQNYFVPIHRLYWLQNHRSFEKAHLVLRLSKKKKCWLQTCSFLFSLFSENVLPSSDGLTLSQTSPGFLRVRRTVLLKTRCKKEKLLVTSSFSFFATVFSTRLKKFLPFSSDLKVSSANSFSLEGSKTCRLGKG